MRKALLVGIDHYDHIGSLGGYVNDAHSVRSVLERHADGTVNFATPRLMAGDDGPAMRQWPTAGFRTIHEPRRRTGHRRGDSEDPTLLGQSMHPPVLDRDASHRRDPRDAVSPRSGAD